MLTEKSCHKFNLMVILFLFLTTGCAVDLQKTAPQRSFTPKDLLVNRDDVPSAWVQTDGPKRVSDNQRSSDSAEIKFSPTGIEISGFRQSVFRYPSQRDAQNDYTRAITFPGETDIEGWSFESDVADEQKMSCYTYSNSEIPVCTWIARYQEFVVEVVAWIGPDQISLSEMEDLVEIIDERIENLFK